VETLLASHAAAGFLETPAIRLAVEDLAARRGDDTRTGLSAPAAEEPLDFLEPSDKPGSIGRLGHYEVQEVVGRGGMGVVLRAFDERLHRVVAIKVIAAQLATSATARRRFVREARAAAAVSHDHVVTIHAVEEDDRLPYIAMQFVAGTSLQERLDRSGPLPLAEILRIGMQTAAGLAAAHAQGLVHRDVKPANILLENGVERVRLTDFGLARAADDASLTQSGTVAGTPSFMSPEQAEGKPVDHRSDLFSLGSVLYAMCTGRPPFRAGTGMGVLKRVCEETPRPIRETNPEVPDWLAAAVARLHAKDPAARFQSAADVAELLGRHLAHVQYPSVAPLPAVAKSAEPTLAPARPERRKRWAVAAAALVAVVAALGTAEATGVTNVRATVIRIFTPEGTLVVETDDPGVKVTVEGDGDLVITGAGPQEVRLKAGSYRLRATKDGKPVKLDRDLVTISRGDKQVVKVRVEGRAVPAAGDVRFEAHRGYVVSVAMSPDGRRVAYGGQDSTVWLCDVATGKELRRFTEHRGVIRSVVFSSDGRWLLSGSEDATMRLWDVETGKQLRCFIGHADAIWCVALSPDGRRALSGSGMTYKDGKWEPGSDYTARLWNVDTGEEVRRFPGHKDRVCSVTFSPDGKRALTGCGNTDRPIRIWNVETGEQLGHLVGHSAWVNKLVFSADGRRALSASSDLTIRLWDLASGKQLRRFQGHERDVTDVAFLPDGRRIISCSWDLTVRLWDLETGLELHRLEGHTGSIWNVAPSPDGRIAVSGAEDGSVRLWRLP
jgi:WD40 repeat protein